MGRPPKDINIRFTEKFSIGIQDNCWEWKGYILPSGYGQFRVGHKKIKAHRFAWEFFIGPIQDNKMVLHKCDNKKCVNPNHLYLGTHSDNMTDAISSNLMGTGRGSTKFYAGEIWLIRKLRAVISGKSYKNYEFSATLVSKMFKSCPSTILNIWNTDKYKCREGCYI
jgi:hypothetical protein